MIITVDAREAFNKIQHLVMTKKQNKTICNVKIERKFLNLVKEV